MNSGGVRQLAPAAAVALWLVMCAMLLYRQLSHVHLGLSGAALLLLCIIAPVVLRNLRRLPIYLLVVYAVLVPFNDLLNVGGTGPTATRLLAMAVGGSLILGMLLKRKIVTPSRSVLVLAVFVTYVAATIFWAVDQRMALNAYGTLLGNALVFLAIALYPMTLRDVNLVLGGTLAGAIIESAYGDFLYWHGQQISGTRLYIGYNDAHSIDPNAFATGLLLPIAVALILFLRTQKTFPKIGWFAALVVLLSAFMLCGSRGATIGAIVMLAFLIVRSRYTKQLLAVGAVCVAFALASPIAQRIAQGDISTADNRTEVWKVGLASLRQYWLAGAGVGNFAEVFNQYNIVAPHAYAAWYRVAHSIFLQSAVEYGVIGLVLLIALWYVVFRELAYVCCTGYVADVSVALRGGVLGLFTAGFSLDLMGYKYTWLALALVALVRSTLRAYGIPVEPPRRRRWKGAEEQLIPLPTSAA